MSDEIRGDLRARRTRPYDVSMSSSSPSELPAADLPAPDLPIPRPPTPDELAERDPLALIFVVDNTHAPDGTPLAVAEDALEAAMHAMVGILTDPRPEVADRVHQWASGPIRKLVKRARAKRWTQINELDDLHVTAASGTARVIVFAPLRPSEQPKPLREAQVSGLELPWDGRPAPEDALTVHVNEALGMSTGKTIAQVGHAVQLFLAQEPDRARQWLDRGGHVQAVAGIPEGDHVVEVIDAGFTEIPPNSLTAAIV